MSLSQKIKSVFLPALWLTLLLSMGSILFHIAQNSLLMQMATQSSLRISHLKILSLIPFLLLGISLLFFSLYKPLEKVLQATLWILVALTLGLFALATFLPWFNILLFMVLDLSSRSFVFLLIWGFINRLVTASEGIKYYIPLAFILGFAGAILAHGAMFGLRGPLPLRPTIIVALISYLLALWLFGRTWKKLPSSLLHPKESASLAKTKFPYISAAYLMGACLMIAQLLKIIVRRPIVGNLGMFVGIATLAFSLVCVLLGSWLILKKGWSWVAKASAFFVVIGSALFFAFPQFSQRLPLFTGLLTAVETALFFPLVQILYLYLPYPKRFPVKVGVEMLILPAMKSFPLLVGLLPLWKSRGVTAIVLLLLLLIAAVWRASVKVFKRA